MGVCTHLLSASALQVCPQPPPATRARVVLSEGTLELGSPPASAFKKPLAPRPTLAACLPTQVHCPSSCSGSVQQIYWKDISRKCAADVWNGAVPGTEASSPRCVFTGCGHGPSVTGRPTRTFSCEHSRAGVPCVWNATLPVPQSGRRLSSPKPPHTFGFSPQVSRHEVF